MPRNSFPVAKLSKEFVPDNTFFIGQVFNWLKTDSGIYCGSMGNKLLEIQVFPNTIEWTLTPPGSESEVRSFLNLSVDLDSLYPLWEQDPFFRKVCKSQPGVRILHQPIFECLISFICSQNCHVSRIAKNLQTLKVHYGQKICFKHGVTWYAFPGVEELGRASEEVLETLGLGYRAKFIVKTVEKIRENGGELWLEDLKEKTTEEIKEELVKLSGIGPKVADCILLFAFNRFSVVPIDTHMWQLARNHYNAPKSKSLTNRVYKDIAKLYQNVFGEYAGWAHSILFAASLKSELPSKPKKSKSAKKPASKKLN